MKILWFPRLQFDINKLHLTARREMCRALEERWKCDVRIAIAGTPCNEVFKDKDYISVFIIRKKFFRILTFWVFGFSKFIYNCLKFKPDIIILDIFTLWFSVPLLILPKRKMLVIVDNRTPFYNRIPNKRTWEDIAIQLYTELSYKYCRRFLDGMTVITDYYKQHVCNDFGFSPSLVGVWGSGVNADIFSPEKVKVNRKPDFLREKFVLMYHGEIGYNRGLFEAIEAIKLINKEGIVLVLIGDGAAKNEILQKIENLKLEKRVYFVPAIPYSEVPVYISYCNCAITPFPDMEFCNNNIAIKLFEYLAMGKVVICTDIWTFRNVAGNKKCLCYIKQNTPEAIAKAINYCYENKEHLGEWGREGIGIVKESYTWHKQSENLLHFIDRLKEKRGIARQ